MTIKMPTTKKITTCQQKVDQKKFGENYDKIFRKKDTITFEELVEVGRIMDEQDFPKDDT